MLPRNPTEHLALVLAALAPLGLVSNSIIVPSGSWKHFSDCLQRHPQQLVKLQPTCDVTGAVVSGIALHDLLSHALLRRLERQAGEALAAILKRCDQARPQSVVPPTHAVRALVDRAVWPFEMDTAEVIRLLLAYEPSDTITGCLGEHATLCALFVPHCPRSYSISSPAPPLGCFATSIDLTVTRGGTADQIAPPVCSNFLNPSTPNSQATLNYGDSVTKQSQEVACEEVLVGLSSSSEFEMPQKPHYPLIFICGGSGVGPFRSMLQELQHIRSKAMWQLPPDKIFIGALNSGAVPYSSELAAMVKLGTLEVHVALSRERKYGKLFTAAGISGLIDLPPDAGKCYIDRALLADRHSLWEYMSLTQDGGWDAHVYICGSVSFCTDSVVPALNAVGEYHQTPIVSHLLTECRLHIESFGVSKVPKIDEPVYGYTDLCRHTSKQDGFWIAIDPGNGACVYDVSDFLSQHPGGMELIMLSCGSDATKVRRFSFIATFK